MARHSTVSPSVPGENGRPITSGTRQTLPTCPHCIVGVLHYDHSTQRTGSFLLLHTTLAILCLFFFDAAERSGRRAGRACGIRCVSPLPFHRLVACPLRRHRCRRLFARVYPRLHAPSANALSRGHGSMLTCAAGRYLVLRGMRPSPTSFTAVRQRPSLPSLINQAMFFTAPLYHRGSSRVMPHDGSRSYLDLRPQNIHHPRV